MGVAFVRVPWKIGALCAAGVLCIAGLFWLALSVRRASHGLDAAKAEVDREGRFDVKFKPLEPTFANGFESISSPSQFTDALAFNGKLYVCGSAGLNAFNQDGDPAGTWRVGLELPPAPLTRLAVGVGASGAGPVLWIGTQHSGLLSFDGSRFYQILPDLDAARSVTALLPLPTGRILIGTEKSGVLAWDGKSLSQSHPALAGFHVTALAGSEADLWVGAIDRGLVRRHAGQTDTLGETEGLPDRRVLSLALGPRSLYVGTALGVAEFRDGKLARRLAPGAFAQTMLVTDDALLVGTLEQGVLSLPGRRPAAEVRDVRRLIPIEGGVLALGRDGLYRNSRRVFEVPGAQLTDRNISALSVDRSGKLWVGYFDRGLDIVEPNLDRLAHYEDDRIFCVNRIAQSGDGVLTAVATANGLTLFEDGKRRQDLTKADGLIANNVADVLLQGRAITLATPAGLTMIDGRAVTSLYAFHGLVNNHAYALAAMDSKLAVGTLGGLSILDRGSIKANFTTSNSGLKQNWITAVQAVGSDWFVGTYGAGVVKLDSSGRWTNFPDLKGHLEINTNAMASTPGAVYAGALGQGLAVYSHASGRWRFIVRGLPSGNVTAVAASNGMLYIGTDNGLVRVSERRLLAE